MVLNLSRHKTRSVYRVSVGLRRCVWHSMSRACRMRAIDMVHRCPGSAEGNRKWVCVFTTLSIIGGAGPGARGLSTGAACLICAEAAERMSNAVVAPLLTAGFGVPHAARGRCAGTGEPSTVVLAPGVVMPRHTRRKCPVRAVRVPETGSSLDLNQKDQPQHQPESGS